jgi:eukaryotic-like serine/threonine-protein kinase
MSILHNPGNIIAERYQIIQVLGQGGMGITYAAKDWQTSQIVALKALSIHRIKDWKVLELFEREAKILANLNHLNIPQYLDYFQIETESNYSFYIVQQLAPGQSLFDLINQGWKPSIEEVQFIASQILETLVYLQQLNPFIIHRDIKPQNIILQENGKIFLVDFGAVQHIYQDTVTGGSTIVGTFGYMAPEQFRGQAGLSTDLYGLGTTLLFLLTEKSPADLPQYKLKINLQSIIKLPNSFADWLERMIEPNYKLRFNSAEEALSFLYGEKSIPPLIPVNKRPQNCAVELVKVGNKLTVKTTIPLPIKLFYCYCLIFGFIVYAGLCNFWIPIFLSIPSIIHPLLSQILLLVTQFIFNYYIFVITSYLCRSKLIVNKHTLKASFEERNLPLTKYRYSYCLIQNKLGKFKFNVKFGLFLSHEEKIWLVHEIRSFLDTLNPNNK